MDCRRYGMRQVNDCRRYAVRQVGRFFRNDSILDKQTSIDYTRNTNRPSYKERALSSTFSY